MMSRLAAAALAVASAVPAQGETVRFAASDAEIANPERGFYRAAPTTLDALQHDWLADVYAGGTRLVYARIDLSRYRSRPIPAALLAKLDQGFAAARAAGVKLIVRAAYNYPRGETGYRSAQDAPMRVVLAQLAQLKPVLAANEDVIAYIQAGFIGAWGEWHTSSNGLTTPAAHARIRDALLDAVPADRSVQFRYPPDLAAWISATAPGSGPARVGFHNDCFLASETDVGTYPDEQPERDQLRAAMATLTARAPFGGETCNPADNAGAVPRADCAAIMDEGARFHLSYLNADYYRRLFHDRWAAQGCLGAVRRRMGYRFTLLSASTDAATRGSALGVELAVRNDGWARLTNPRPIRLVLVGGDGTAHRLTATGADPRSWLPGATARVSLSAPLPAALPAGRYVLAVGLPDAGERLREDPRYAIRFANADVTALGQRWDGARGLFVTGIGVDVR